MNNYSLFLYFAKRSLYTYKYMRRLTYIYQHAYTHIYVFNNTKIHIK